MKNIFVFVLIVVALSTSGLKRANALEWSEEVQMTHAGETLLCGQYFGSVVDSRDVIHVCYYVLRAGIEGQTMMQPAYQKFSKHGEPLIEPIFMGSFIPLNGLGVFAWDIFIDRNEFVHILWGRDSLYHTMFNLDGEHILSARLEGILGNSALSNPDALPRGAVDSQDRLTVVSRTCTPWDTVAQRREVYISYGRWTFDGALIDTLHILEGTPSAESANDPQICVSQGDTLHFSWNHNPHLEAWWYAKVGPNDEVVNGPLELFRPTEDEYRLGLGNFLVDDQFNITFRVYVRDNNRRNLSDHLMQFYPNLDIRFDRVIDGPGYGLVSGHILSGLNNEILLGASRFVPDEPYGISYARFTQDGDYLDSLQFPQQGTTWGAPRPILFSDSTVAVLWHDHRFARGERGNELFMRYSLPPNRVADTGIPQPKASSLISAQPNPFNGTVAIGFRTPKVGKYMVKVYTMKGEVVWSKDVVSREAEEVRINWDGRSSDGTALPTGSYLCVVDGIATKQLMLKLVK